MQKMTQEQKDKYLSSDDESCKCPYCQSTDIESGCGIREDRGNRQDVVCNTCKSVWHEVFMLVDVKDGEI